MNCDCGCHDSPHSDFEMRMNGCDVCKDAHTKKSADVLTTDILKQAAESISGIPAVPEKKEDEFGDIYVFSEERLAKLKDKANTEYTAMVGIIKNAESALSGFAEWARAAEANEKRFVTASKTYVATLKEIEDEMIKTKF